MLCLQEVQSDAYQQFFQPHLSEKGYDGLYKAKTREGAMGKVSRSGVMSPGVSFCLAMYACLRVFRVLRIFFLVG